MTTSVCQCIFWIWSDFKRPEDERILLPVTDFTRPDDERILLPVTDSTRPEDERIILPVTVVVYVMYEATTGCGRHLRCIKL